jgi:branched-chain amino acid aminotransferase
VDATLGVKSASEFIFFILTLPSGGYFKGAGEGPGAIDVLVSTSVVRTTPGLMGSVKAGANYAGTLTITEHAKTIGCSQVLFLDSHHHQYIEEMGGMNIMFVEGNVLRTPPLTDTILRGVTRDSLLVLAKDQGLDVSEAPITIDEVVAGVKNGGITEMFACGTAAVVIGIRSLQFEDGSSVRTTDCPGPATRRLYDALTAVQYGRVPDPHGWLQEVCPADAGIPLPLSVMS